MKSECHEVLWLRRMRWFFFKWNSVKLTLLKCTSWKRKRFVRSLSGNERKILRGIERDLFLSDRDTNGRKGDFIFKSCYLSAKNVLKVIRMSEMSKKIESCIVKNYRIRANVKWLTNNAGHAFFTFLFLKYKIRSKKEWIVSRRRRRRREKKKEEQVILSSSLLAHMITFCNMLHLGIQIFHSFTFSLFACCYHLRQLMIRKISVTVLQLIDMLYTR